MQWKGGFLRTIFKGKGDASLLSTSRSVLASSQVGKRWHAILRARVMPHLEHTVGDSQYAGIKGRGTDQASFVLRSLHAWGKAAGVSVGTLFADAKDAFYRTIRELVVEGNLDDKHIASVIRAAGLPPEAMHALAARLSEAAAMRTAGIPAHLRAPLATVGGAFVHQCLELGTTGGTVDDAPEQRAALVDAHPLFPAAVNEFPDHFMAAPGRRVARVSVGGSQPR